MWTEGFRDLRFEVAKNSGMASTMLAEDSVSKARLRARMELRLAAMPRDTLIYLLAEASADHNRTRAKVDAALCQVESPPPMLRADVLELALTFSGTFAKFRAMRVCREWQAVARSATLHKTVIVASGAHSMVRVESGPQQLTDGPWLVNNFMFDNEALLRCVTPFFTLQGTHFRISVCEAS